jgi:hypothetical protein
MIWKFLVYSTVTIAVTVVSLFILAVLVFGALSITLHAPGGALSGISPVQTSAPVLTAPPASPGAP